MDNPKFSCFHVFLQGKNKRNTHWGPCSMPISCSFSLRWLLWFPRGPIHSLATIVPLMYLYNLFAFSLILPARAISCPLFAPFPPLPHFPCWVCSSVHETLPGIHMIPAAYTCSMPPFPDQSLNFSLMGITKETFLNTRDIFHPI